MEYRISCVIKTSYAGTVEQRKDGDMELEINRSW